MPVPLGLSVLSDRLVVIVNPGTASEWRFSNGGESPVKIVTCKVSQRKGKDAQAASMKLVDYSTADWWRKLTFGTKVKILADGAVVFFGTIATRAYWTQGAPVGLNLQLVGRTSVLYSDVVATLPAQAPYTGKTTAYIANDLIATVFPSLTRSHITTTDGFVVPEFDVSVGDNVGDLLERLTKMDGFVYDVDEADDVHYYYPQATNQGTITDDDLRGRADEVFVEEGVIPPRNVVRILGMASGGYVTKTIQEQHDSFFTQDAAAKWVAQRFIAPVSRLSGLDVYLDRSASPNQPNLMSIEIRTSALGSLYNPGTNVLGTGSFPVDSAAKRISVAFTPTGSASQLRFLQLFTFRVFKTGAPNNPQFEVRADDGAGNPGALIATLTPTMTIVSGSQWKADVSLSDESVPTNGKTWFVMLPASNADGSNYWASAYATNAGSASGNKNSTDSGSSWNSQASNTSWFYSAFAIVQAQPSATKVEFSDDLSIAYTDVPYPQQYSTTKFWAAPKLQLAAGTPYWVLFHVGTASASVFWKYGYQNAAPDPLANACSLQSADSGSTWTSLGYDLAMHLYWASGPVDVTITNTRAKLTAGVDNATTSFPVDRLDDFDTLPKLCDVTTSGVTETVNVTARSAATGAGTLTVQRAQAGTSAASHNSGDYVVGDSIRSYGPYPYTAQDDTILDNATATAVAGVVLQNHATPASRLKLPLRTLRTDLTVRNLVTVQRRFLDFNQALEIVQLDHEWTEDGNAFTTPQVGALDYDAARAIEELRQEVHA